MVKKRGPGRPPKVRRGRPKGSRNRQSTLASMLKSLPDTSLEYVKDYPAVNLKSRLDECMVRLETAVAEAISKMKEMI